MAVPLQVDEDHDDEQASDVQAVPGGIESYVRRRRALREGLGDPFGVLIDQPSPLEFLEHSFRLHWTKLGRREGDCQSTRLGASRRLALTFPSPVLRGFCHLVLRPPSTVDGPPVLQTISPSASQALSWTWRWRRFRLGVHRRIRLRELVSACAGREPARR